MEQKRQFTKEAPSCDPSSSRGMANVRCPGCPSFAFVGRPSFAAEAQGFVEPQSCDYFTGYLLHFEELDTKKLATPIVLMFPQSCFWDNMVDQKDPWRVSSPDCTSSSACE